MRIWWYLLAVISGFLAFMTVWLWPVTPIWRIPADNLRHPFRFHPEENILYTLHYRSPKGDPECLCRWNVSTKRMESKTEFAPGRIAGLSGDCQYFFFRNAFGDVAIADSISGNVVQKPRWLRLFDSQQTSSNGRYYYSIFQEDVHFPKATHVLRFSSVENGESLFELKGQTVANAKGLFIGEDSYPFRCHFSTKNDAVALLWYPPSKAFVTIHSLPDGKETAHYLLPEKAWDSVSEWDGRYLLMMQKVSPESIQGSWQYSLFDTMNVASSESLHDPRELLVEYAPESSLEQWHSLGRNWICQFQVRRIASPFGQWYVDLQKWLRQKMGWTPLAEEYQCTVKRIDRATGNYRLIVLPNRGGIVSPDGRYLASTSLRASEIDIWDLDPIPRWYLSLATGLGTAAPILLLGRWRFKRTQRTALSQLPPPVSK